MGKQKGGSSTAKGSNPRTKLRRKRSWERGQERKDRNVKQSSKGKFNNVAELEAHRMKAEGRTDG